MSGHAQFGRKAHGNKDKKLWRGTVGGISVIDDIIATSDLGQPENPKHFNRNWKKDAKFYRAKTRFAIKMEDGGYEIYPCDLLVAEIKGGKRYVYDLVDIGQPTHAATVATNVTTFNGSGAQSAASTASTAVSANPTANIIAKPNGAGNGGIMLSVVIRSLL